MQGKFEFCEMIPKATHYTRWLIGRDIDDLMEVERQIRHRKSIGLVVEDGSKAIGYLVYLTYADHLEIDRLAVNMWHQRDGAGSALIDRLKLKLASGD